jgi:hypothetical protein
MFDNWELHKKWLESFIFVLIWSSDQGEGHGLRHIGFSGLETCNLTITYSTLQLDRWAAQLHLKFC